MEQNSNQLPKIFVVSEPCDLSLPQASNSAWEAVILSLSKYYQVFFFIPYFQKTSIETFKTEVKTENNFIALKIIIKKSSFSFINDIRLKKAYFAANKIYQETTQHTDIIIYKGIESLFFNLSGKAKTQYGKIMIADKITSNFPKQILQKKIKAIKNYFFLSEETKNNFAVFMDKDAYINIITQPIIDENFAEQIIEKQSILVVISYEDDTKITAFTELLNKFSSKNPEIKINISVALHLIETIKGKLIAPCTFVKDNKDYQKAVSISEKIVITGDYQESINVVAELMASRKPILFLTNHISESFPFKGYCQIYEKDAWNKNTDILNNFINNTIDLNKDIDELIGDNHSPEIIAFALKQRVDLILSNNHSVDE